MTTIAMAYQCDAQGVLIGETLVQEDPLTPGEFLLPPGATLAAPPSFDSTTEFVVFENGAWTVHPLAPVEEPIPVAAPVVPTAENRPTAQENEIAVIVDGQWRVLPDFRGTVYWLADGSRHVITDLGETPPAAALTSPPSEQAVEP